MLLLCFGPAASRAGLGLPPCEHGAHRARLQVGSPLAAGAEQAACSALQCCCAKCCPLNRQNVAPGLRSPRSVPLWEDLLGSITECPWIRHVSLRFTKLVAFSGVHILPSGSFFFPPETSTCLETSCCICSFTSVTVVFVITAVTIDSFGAE